LPGRLTRLVDAVCDQALDQIEAAESLALTAVDPARAVRWGRSVGRALWAARPYLLRPAPDTPWSAQLSGPRRLAWQDLPLSEAREIRAALGGKVNDVVLTALAGALRRYFLLHGWKTDGVVLRVAVPVNARSDGDARELGNHVSMMLAGLPLGVADPVARFRTISGEMTSLKKADQAGGVHDFLTFFGRLPAPLQAALGRRMTAPNPFTNLLCTNVRGPETPLYCLGHEMVSHYPWVLVTWRMGLGVAVMSYKKNLSVSFTGDAAVLPDIERIAEFLADDFRELHDAVAQPRERPVPLETAAIAAPRPEQRHVEIRTIAPERTNGVAPVPRTTPAFRDVGPDTEWML
jgi:WS/DGAT/MGAT family acyltransferase